MWPIMHFVNKMLLDSKNIYKSHKHVRTYTVVMMTVLKFAYKGTVSEDYLTPSPSPHFDLLN